MLDAVADPAPNARTGTGGQPRSGRTQPSGRIWRVAYTHPQAERYACNELQRRGYETFLPLVWTTRTDRVVRSLRHRIQAPAFPRYVFVLADGQWTPIRYTAGVADLVWSEHGKPGAVADSLIAALRSALAASEAQDGAEVAWKAGQPCSLALGPLRGRSAVVLSVGHATARIAVLLFGELRTVVAPIASLVPRE